MMQCSKSSVSAPPPQSPQVIVIGVTRARAPARTVQLKDCGDCGGCQAFRVPVGTMKRHIAGKGNAENAAAIAAVWALGFDPAEENEADALTLLDWALKVGGRR